MCLCFNIIIKQASHHVRWENCEFLQLALQPHPDFQEIRSPAPTELWTEISKDTEIFNRKTYELPSTRIKFNTN